MEEKKSDQLGLPQTLQQEFSLINVQIRNVNVEVRRGLTGGLALAVAVCGSGDRFGQGGGSQIALPL